MNSVRPTSSFTGAKSKKQLKNKIRGQQQGQSSNSVNSNSNSNDNFSNEKDKGSPLKEFQDYAGISSESTRIYAEQTSYDQLTEEACNLLTEDINYKLRHIIHDCLIKSKLQGRDAITAEDVEETFSNLNVDKVYGAPSSPNWLPFRDRQETTLYHLDDQRVNLIEMAEKDINVSQEGDAVLDQVWLPDGNDSEDEMDAYNETYAEYFETMCEAVISDDDEIRQTALVDISTNPSIGPITDWFYHFSYFLLLNKDINSDRFTMRTLQLLEVLENSPLPSLHVYEKQLKLLVHLLLQRLLSMSTAKEDVVKHMCYVLSIFCLRAPLKSMVLKKVEEKIVAVCQDMAVPLLNIIYYIGIDAIKRIFVPNLAYFLARVVEEYDPNMSEIVLAIYGLLCKSNLNTGLTYSLFEESFAEVLIPLTPYYRPKYIKAAHEKKDIDIVKMKRKLIKTRRKVDYRNRNIRSNSLKLEEVFEIVSHSCSVEQTKLVEQTTGRNRKETQGGIRFKMTGPCCILKTKLENHKQFCEATKSKKETQITVGKTSLLLSVLKREHSAKCFDHSLFSCWL